MLQHTLDAFHRTRRANRRSVRNCVLNKQLLHLLHGGQLFIKNARGNINIDKTQSACRVRENSFNWKRFFYERRRGDTHPTGNSHQYDVCIDAAWNDGELMDHLSKTKVFSPPKWSWRLGDGKHTLTDLPRQLPDGATQLSSSTSKESGDRSKLRGEVATKTTRQGWPRHGHLSSQ